MVYCMGPKETTAAIEAIESNIPDGWSVERFADGFSVWSQSPERMVGNMKRRADGWIAYSYVTDRAEWFRYIADAAKWTAVPRRGSKPKIEAPTFPELFDKIVTAALEMRDAVEQTTEVADDPAGEWTPNFWHCGPPLFTGVPPCGQVPLG